MLQLAVLYLAVYCVSAEWYEESAARYSGDQGTHVGGYNKFFAGWTLEKVKSIMGTRLDGANRPGVHIKKYLAHEVVEAQLPSHFVAGVDKWQSCASTINFIKDQAACGSCWAVAASEVVADRLCITEFYNNPNPPNPCQTCSGTNEQSPLIDMSSEQILSCCSWCGDGCQGGYPIDAMMFWKVTGIVTGGWYGSNCGCYPYGIPPCPSPNGCQEGPTPSCHTSCQDSYNCAFNDAKDYASNYYQINDDVKDLQTEIYNNGPIECAFTVYENFMSYKSGVYTEARGRELGGHAVICVGWGTLDGVPYWIFHNSWNVTWGMQGKFWFKRGGDLCGMESQCVAGIAKPWSSSCLLTICS